MATKSDKKSMILQALLTSPELMEVVLEGLSEFSELDEKSRNLVQECVHKVQEIREQWQTRLPAIKMPEITTILEPSKLIE